MTVLKRDLFGTVSHDIPGEVLRDSTEARWWLRVFARHLARCEARALFALAGIHGVPSLIALDQRGGKLRRTWIDGEPMQHAKPADPQYFRLALQLLRRLHARRVVHNDLAKETNWLVTPTGEPALVDFQLARIARRRGKLFRLLGHDDLRHLLKHKRSYLPERLTARELRILATPSIVSRLWMGSGKRVYVFITRRLLKWSDREGANDRLHDAPETR